MQKVLLFSVDDIAADTSNVAQALAKACNGRTDHFRVRGLCQIEDEVYFVLLPRPRGETREDYVFAPLEDISDMGMQALLEERWEAGFDTVGLIDLGEDSYLMLYARPQETG